MQSNLPDHIQESRARLIGALRRAGTLATEEAAAVALGLERVPAGIAGSLLDVIVRGDLRFQRDADGRWRFMDGGGALRDQQFVVLDVETTGGHAPADRIIDLGAVRVTGGCARDEFVALINPERQIPRDITRLTGITTAMVADKPTALELLPSFADWLGNAIIVAHNAPFDRFFVDAHWREVFGEPTSNTWLCSVRVARKLYPEIQSRSLEPLCAALGIDAGPFHRAGNDARATARVFLRELDDLAARGITDVAGLFALVSPTRLRSPRRTRYEHDPAAEAAPAPEE